MAVWVTLGRLKEWANIDPADTRDDAALQSVLDVVASWVETARPDLTYTDTATVPVHVQHGAAQLAYRLRQRSRSPEGLFALGDVLAGRIPKVDPDIERMLGIGMYAVVLPDDS